MINAALRFPVARNMIAQLGPELFGSRVVKKIARAIVTGDYSQPSGLLPRENAEAKAFIADLSDCTIPGDEPWAVHLVLLLAESRFRDLLADQLAWAAEKIRTGAPVRFIARRILAALQIALGRRPFDPLKTWQEVAQ